MKKYIQPKIKAIKLDSDQAILQVCKVGGDYFGVGTNGTNKCQKADDPTLGSSTCLVAVKGVNPQVNTLNVTSLDQMPS
ncbi:MAG: hypothetical protein PHQ52_01475 [Candidatus Omnitrophica bacterium]|nr:hypothetical protein [Candidatus Omnitrophota bacterium]